MKWHVTTLMTAGLLAAAVALTHAAASEPHKKTPAAPPPKLNFEVVNQWKIGGTGQWASITLDSAGKYLYIPRGEHTLVVDTATGKVAEIPTQSAVYVAVVPDVNRGFITNSKQGTVTVFDLKTNAVLGDVAVGANPSDIIYDPASKRLLVQCGDFNLVPLIPDIDLKTGKPESAITFDGEIRGLLADDQGTVYVSLNDKGIIAVLDTRIMDIATQWHVRSWDHPAALSMDRLHSRLFICCNNDLTILSASDGHILDQVPLPPTHWWNYSSAYYDSHVYGVCGNGTMTIVGQKEDGAFVVDDTVNVKPNSKPIAIDQKTGKIYLPTQQVNGWTPVPDTFKLLVLQRK